MLAKCKYVIFFNWFEQSKVDTGFAIALKNRPVLSISTIKIAEICLCNEAS